jgi:signal transduction histidine kinase
VTGELGRLNECVVLELEDYGRNHPALSREVMAKARAVWAEMIGLESSRSIAEYFRLRQVEAAGHIQDLEQALEKLQELEQQRADLWHQAAHDMRGNLHVVVSAMKGMSKGGASPPIQENFLRVLDRNVTSLRHLLDDVMDLARLQAGRESRDVSAVDVAALLASLCDALATLAEERGLYLKYVGPSRFEVQGDAVKIRRIVQNSPLGASKLMNVG